MKFGVLTGGGDVPGLNPAIRAVTLRAIEAGHEVVGLRRGLKAFTSIDPSDAHTIDEHTITLDSLAVRTIGRTGGTFLHSSRTNPGRVTAADVPDFLSKRLEGVGPFDLTPHALSVIERLGIDVLIPIGGDDTLSYGLRLHEEGVPVIAIPKTMDNDVPGTDYCLGFATAVNRSLEYITNLRTATASHERIAVVELFGRYSGQTSLVSGFVAGVDRIVISEVPVDADRLTDFLMEDRAANPSNYAVMTISEGASLTGGQMSESGKADPFGHRKLGGIGQQLGDHIKERTGVGIIGQNIGYLMRSGPPDALDTMIATNFGNLAVDLALAGESGLMVSLRNGIYSTAPLTILASGARSVDVERFYDIDRYTVRVGSVLELPFYWN